jgi:Spy/CpxP family protein refolding chaperone
MNFTNKNKIFSTVIILLLIINTATVTFLLLKKDRHLPPPHQQMGNAFEFLVKELNMDSSQKNQYQLLKVKHKEAVDIYREQLKSTKNSLFKLLENAGVMDTSVQKYLNAVALINRQIDEITFSHFKQVRTICNPDQQKKFDKVIIRALEMQSPKGLHRPPSKDEDRPPRDEQDPNHPPEPYK